MTNGGGPPGSPPFRIAAGPVNFGSKINHVCNLFDPASGQTAVATYLDYEC
jgi:hypothetical protein